MEMAESEAEAAEATTAKFMNAQEATQTAIQFLRSLGYRTAKPNKSSSDGEKATVEIELKRERASVVIDGKTREILEYDIEKTEQRSSGGSMPLKNIRLILMIMGINVLILALYTFLTSPGAIPLPI